LFVEQTSEDPAQRAHEDFLEELVDVADDRKTFTARANALTVNAYLTSMRTRSGRGK
jgi:hypothetical protein